ncbi:two-component regulator propeller domain-containing protein [Abyssalbus ytuae]|uniref:histidine kinase n=1 Tax=Abyssalbus ytuae TaxID=2926907 RepID=A0A9E6ZJB8_9FLAO|nr:two-component regulator propeller domain-containing protein [Abyssalbus ytuae]UOB16619.1 response regulator [Abyssalbus ytuae]
MRIIFFTLIIFLLSITSCISQSYSIEYLNMKDGLSNDYIVDIEGDKDGYVWFATEEGLNRYDGNTVVSFYKSNINANTVLNGNELNKILDDPTEKIMWVATKREGLSAYNYTTNSFTTYQPREGENSISSLGITDLEISQDGNLWIATYNHGVDHFDKSTNNFTHYNSKTVKNLVSNYSWAVVDDGNGKLYVGHKDAGLSVININTKEATNYQNIPNDESSIPGNDVRCVYMDKSGGIWVGTNNGLALFNPSDSSFTNFGNNDGPLSRWVTDISHFSDNSLWVSTRFDGIIMIDLSQRFFSDFSELKIKQVGKGNITPDLSSLNTRCLYQDEFGNIWIGTWGGGVNFLKNTTTTFNTIRLLDNNYQESSVANSILSISQDHEQNIWAGTYGAGIFKIRNNEVVEHFYEKNLDFSANTIQAIHCDRNDNLWFGVMSGGVLVYDKTTNKFNQAFPDLMSQSDVTAICETNDGKILVGTNDNGIFIFDINTYRFLGKLDIEEALIRSIIIDDIGNILIGTYGVGMKIYSKNLKLLHTYHMQTGFISNTINHIYKDREGKIWVATGNGLIQLKNGYKGEFQAYGESNINVRALVEDTHGNIWYSTNKGLNCMEMSTSNILEYGYKDNISTSSYSSASVLKAHNNQLYFGSLHGISFFNPSNVLKSRKTPKPFFSLLNVYEPIKGQFIDEKQSFIPVESKLELDYTQNNFKVSFAVKDYSLTNQIEYSYMLKGQSESWFPVLGANEITFRNLSPGNYNLLLRNRIRNQDWSDEYATLDIVLTPPFWLTWWAKLFYFLVGILVALGFMYYRERKIRIEYLYQSEKQKHQHDQELNDERLRFYTNITHELRTPLTLILGPIEDILKSPYLNTKDRNRLLLIHNNTVRLRNLVNRLLDFRKTETSNKQLVVGKYNIVSVVTEIGMRFKQLNQNPNVKILINSSQNNIPLTIDKEAIIMILDNLISNAIKYTSKGSITISVSKTTENGEPFVELNIKDTGQGISEEDLPKIFDRYYQKGGKQHYSGTGIGLALVKNLTTLHEGIIRVEGAIGVGTSISILLKENNIYPHASRVDEEETQDMIGEEGVDNFEEDIKIDHTVVLIIEDNRDICEYLKDELESSYEVQIAYDGKQGLDLALETIPDIIISDIMMPVMDGFELCKKLKEDMRTCHIPIVLLTAKDSSLSKEEGYESGADSYLTKPFSSSLLKTRIKNLLQQRDILANKYSISKTSLSTHSTETTDNESQLTIRSLTGLDEEFLEKAKNLIIENLSNGIVDVQYLSENMFMSSSTLYRKIKAITNLSTTEFIRKIKIKESERLLLERKYTLSEIAFKIGINSQVYFRKCFKEEFGCTPTDYLKNKRTSG